MLENMIIMMIMFLVVVKVKVLWFKYQQLILFKK